MVLDFFFFFFELCVLEWILKTTSLLRQRGSHYEIIKCFRSTWQQGVSSRRACAAYVSLLRSLRHLSIQAG